MRHSKAFSTFVLFFTLSLCGGLAEAKPKKPRAHKSETPAAAPSSEPSAEASPSDPIETIQARLLKSRRSKVAKRLAKAQGALDQEHYGEAKTIASPIQKDPIFSDYGLWISAQALKGQANQAWQAKKFDSAQKLSKQAISLFHRIHEEKPYSPFLKDLPSETVRLELLEATSAYSAKHESQALRIYDDAFQRASNLSGSGLHILAPLHVRQYAEACKKKPTELCEAWIQRLASAFPRASEETKSVLKLFPDALDSVKAAPTAPRATQTYKAPDPDLGAFDAAMAEYLDGKYKKAIDGFKGFIDEFPKSGHRYRARYWMGQALTHQQDHERAQKVFEELFQDTPTSYYGILAAMAIGKPFDALITQDRPETSPTDPMLFPGELLRLKRAEYFTAEKAYKLAAIELRDFHARPNLSDAFLLYLASLNFLAQNHHVSFSLLGELIQRGYKGVYTPTGLKLIFPVPFLEAIRKYSALSKVDPILVLSLIKQESAFNSTAVSAPGASGLMQLMPATALDVDSEISRSDLVKEEINIRVGSRYLSQLISKFGGNTVVALAGYNAGPAVAARWLKDKPEKRGMLEFIETIPYRETREYVSSIIRNYYWYAKLVNGETPKSLDYFWVGGTGEKASPSSN